MQSLEKNKLLLFPFFMGIILMAYSWYSSYPLSIDSVDDFIFNHVSVLYWFSLPLMLTSMYMLAVTSKSHILKWIIAVGIVMTIYSLSYFYYMLPGSDSHYFRGLTEYFVRTENLDPSQLNHGYFQWPSFFVLANIATSVSGLELANFQFLLYTVIGFLLATTLHVYASKTFKNGGFLAVVAFFIGIRYFLNYQCVPFSLALGLLFILFMLETRQKSFSAILTMLVLFTSISITHAFVPLFFVIYLLIRCILNRSKQYGRLFLLTLIIYLVAQVTQAQFSFADNIRIVMTLPSEYSRMAEVTLAPVTVPTDVIAQMFSRTVTISTVMICFAGFIFLLIKKKLRDLDKAIFLTGALYSALGILFYTLGSRAIPIAFVPISLGALYIFESKFRPYLICLFLILLSLFVFIPLHTSFIDSPIMFQTKEAHTTANFMIEKYDWNAYSTILSHVSAKWYIYPQIEGNSIIDTDISPRFLSSDIEAYECIIYSVSLQKNLLRKNISEEETSRRILDRFNVIYHSGFSYIAKKSR